MRYEDAFKGLKVIITSVDLELGWMGNSGREKDFLNQHGEIIHIAADDSFLFLVRSQLGEYWFNPESITPINESDIFIRKKIADEI